MKYLKKFNEGLVTYLQDSGYDDLIKNKIHISKSDLVKINSYLLKLKRKLNLDINFLDGSIYIIYKPFAGIWPFKRTIRKVTYKINKIEDEWFIIDMEATTDLGLGELNFYYKCDDIDGLLEYLKRFIENKFIKNNLWNRIFRFNESNKEYYEEIEREVFGELLDNFELHFDKKYFDKVGILNDKWEFRGKISHMRFTKTSYIGAIDPGNKNIKDIDINQMEYNCDVFQLKDEYFIVSFTDYTIRHGIRNNISAKYYKCDQWEGVQMLLKNKGVIK